jgi:hypothetical protein
LFNDGPEQLVLEIERQTRLPFSRVEPPPQERPTIPSMIDLIDPCEKTAWEERT